MRRFLFAAALVAATLILVPPAKAGGGCHGGGAASGKAATVELAMNCMNPRVLRAPEGAGTITFVNRDAVVHNLYGEGWGVDELRSGASVAREFPTGTHVYACTLHPGMVGAIVVGDGVGAVDAAAPVRAVSTHAEEGAGSAQWPLAAAAGAVFGAAGTIAVRRVRTRAA